MYWFVFGVLLVNASICFFAKKDFKPLYYASIVMLTLFLCLRWGQGIDYFNYMLAFEDAPGTFDLQHWYYSDDVHGEIGWKILYNIFRVFGFSFIFFVAVIGFLSMFFIHLFICRMCPSRNLALLLIFPTLYLTYFFSGLRQGFAISLFLGIVLKYLLQKRYVLFVLGVILCMTFHFATVVYIVPLVVVLLNMRPSAMWLLFYLCLVGGIVLALPVTQGFIRQLPLPGSVYYYISTSHIYWPAVLERVAMFGFVLTVYFLCKEQDRSPVVKLAMTVYIFSVAMYMPFFWLSIFGRFAYPLKLFEVILLSTLLSKLTRWRGLVYSFIVLASCAMFYKNLDSYISLSGYVGVSAIDYPYISIFNQEDIHQYLPWAEGRLQSIYELRLHS